MAPLRHLLIAQALFARGIVRCVVHVSGGVCLGRVLNCLLLAFLLLLHALDLRFVNGALCGISRQGTLAIHHRLDGARRRKFLHHLARVHAQRAKGSKSGFQSAVVNLFGMKLLFDPLIYANRHDALHVARPWAKGEAVKSMHGALLLLHLRRH